MQSDQRATRMAVYRHLWGEPTTVVREDEPKVPSVDIVVYGPRMNQNGVYQAHSTLVTAGMSDMPLAFPPDSNPPYHRAELVMYVTEPNGQHFRLLQFLAHYPHEAKRYYVYGHTVPNAEPFFTASQLSVALLLQSPVHWDARLPELLQIESQPVELLWVQPITAEEWEVKRHKGIDVLLEVFDEHRLTPVLDERRASLV